MRKEMVLSEWWAKSWVKSKDEVEPELKEWPMNYYVYILRTSFNTFYTGQTNNLEKRLKEHKDKTRKSSKYMRSFKSFELVYCETYSTLSKALKREAAIKKWPKTYKLKLILNQEKGLP